MDKKDQGNWVGAALLTSIVVAGSVAIYLEKKRKNEYFNRLKLENADRQVYFVGGGLGSLAGAVYLIRDCHFKGENIHIIEGLKLLL